jgi:hypothetical protein
VLSTTSASSARAGSHVRFGRKTKPTHHSPPPPPPSPVFLAKTTAAGRPARLPPPRAGPQAQQQQQQQQQQQSTTTTTTSSTSSNNALRPGETPDQAAERRARESLRVEERVRDVADAAAWRAALAAAGDRLVVLEVEAEGVCQTGLDEEAEAQWELDRRAALRPCAAIKSTLQRTARECPDVEFLSLSADTDEGSALCAELGVEVLPTIQFWRRGALLWEHKGVLALEQDLGEGVLYFGGAEGAGGRLDAGGVVAELASRADLDAFVAGPSMAPPPSGGEQQAAAGEAAPPTPAAPNGEQEEDRVLSVVDVSTSGATPCIHVFPAVVALARSFAGYARFARLLVADDQPELLRDLGVVEVPTFIFYRGGKEVARHVGSSRGDLMGRIMEVQAEAGVRPPPPPSAAAKRRVPERRVIKRRV